MTEILRPMKIEVRPGEDVYAVARILIKLATMQPTVEEVPIKQITAMVGRLQLAVDVEYVSAVLRGDYDGTKSRELTNNIVDQARDQAGHHSWRTGDEA